MRKIFIVQLHSNFQSQLYLILFNVEKLDQN